MTAAREQVEGDESSAAESSAAESGTAVLLSGGLDSAVLAGELLATNDRVYPLYVRCGLVWEADESAALDRFLATEPFASAAATGQLAERVVIDAPVASLYGCHWSLTGRGTPDDHSPDAAVYLPGRNLLLVTAAAIWCRQHVVHRLALAPLAANPFPDATDDFFRLFERTLSIGLAHRLEILRPLASASKQQVIERGRRYRLDLTFSCIAPVDGLHCGRCNKCAERRAAFRAIDWPDPTTYAAVKSPQL